jgi:hypothetical protein
MSNQGFVVLRTTDDSENKNDDDSGSICCDKKIIRKILFGISLITFIGVVYLLEMNNMERRVCDCINKHNDTLSTAIFVGSPVIPDAYDTGPIFSFRSKQVMRREINAIHKCKENSSPIIVFGPLFSDGCYKTVSSLKECLKSLIDIFDDKVSAIVPAIDLENIEGEKKDIFNEYLTGYIRTVSEQIPVGTGVSKVVELKQYSNTIHVCDSQDTCGILIPSAGIKTMDEHAKFLIDITHANNKSFIVDAWNHKHDRFLTNQKMIDVGIRDHVIDVDRLLNPYIPEIEQSGFILWNLTHENGEFISKTNVCNIYSDIMVWKIYIIILIFITILLPIPPKISFLFSFLITILFVYTIVTNNAVLLVLLGVGMIFVLLVLIVVVPFLDYARKKLQKIILSSLIILVAIFVLTVVLTSSKLRSSSFDVLNYSHENLKSLGVN